MSAVEERRSAARGTEFASGWPMLLGATLGISVGVIALPMPAIGVFMRDLQAQFGWTRAEISLGPTILAVVLAMVSPALGWLADRFAAAWIALVSLCALALCFLLLSRLGPDLAIYYAAFAAMAVAGCGATTLVYARLVSAHFVSARGLALGIAMIGNGITGIVLPILLVPYAAYHGWRQGCVALALVIAVAAPVVALLIGGRTARSTDEIPGERVADASGSQFADSMRDPVFWTLAVCFTSISLASTGLNLHFLAFLEDAHVSAAEAGFIASLIGVALIAGRLITGWLMDRLFAPHIAAGIMAVSALCLIALGVFGAPAAPLGALAIGLSIGSEVDLIGYLTARYFGLRAFGRIYGLLYAAALAGSASSPVIYGLAVDLTASYTIGLYAAAALLALSAVLFLTLRPFVLTSAD